MRNTMFGGFYSSKHLQWLFGHWEELIFPREIQNYCID